MQKIKAVILAAGIMIALNPYPRILNAQSKVDPCVQAQLDAEADVSGTMWLAIGFLLSFPVGWPILPMLLEPSPPSHRVIGKSPEYIATYTSCYKEAGKRIQQSKALIGCLIGAVVWVAFYWLFWAAWWAAVP